MSAHSVESVTPSVPQLPHGSSALDYALAYAASGLFVLPVLRATKNPGSVVGAHWPTLSSRDPQQIVSWFAGTDYGIAIHAGRSGLVIIDVDYPDRLPAQLKQAFTLAHPIQQTRMGEPGRGHHLFKMPAGRRIGNSLGTLPKGWGDVRGLGGVIVVAPSVHPDAGGFYHWLATGQIPTLPPVVADELPDAGENSSTVNNSAVTEFIKTHNQNNRPTLLKAVLQAYALATASGESRHGALVSALSWAMREAKMGYYPAQEAIEQIREAHAAMVAGERDVKAELLQALPWVIAQAIGDDSSARGSGVEQRTGEAASGSLSALERLTGKPVALEPASAPVAPDAPAVDPLEALVTPDAEREDFVPSWGAIDLTEYIDGTHEEIKPELFMRIDGQCLLYKGRVHSFHGESESGKSWLGQIETARVLISGGTAAFIDYESNPASVVARLLLLGVPAARLRPGGPFRYIKPEGAPWANGEAEQWENLLATEIDLVILDGVTEALSTMAVSSNDNDELTAWIRAIPRKIAHSTGAALVMVDHVVKSREEGGRFAIGGQAKLAALDGAAFVVEIGGRPLGKGMVGEIIMRLAKDREGGLRGIAGKYRKSDRTQEIARVVVDSTSDAGITVTVGMPASEIGDGVEVESADGDVQSAGFRPTHVMETMSKFVETAPAQPTGNTLTKDFAVNIDGSRKTRELALKLLVKEGYLITEAGVRNSVTHRSVKPYRTSDDPLSPKVESLASELNKLVGNNE